MFLLRSDWATQLMTKYHALWTQDREQGKKESKALSDAFHPPASFPGLSMPVSPQNQRVPTVLFGIYFPRQPNSC